MLTENEYKQLAHLIVRNDWDEKPIVREHNFTVEQFQGTAFDSDYKCYRVTKGNISLVAKLTNSTEGKLLQLLHQHDFPVPNMICTLRNPAWNPKLHLLFEEYVSGTELYACKEKQPWISTAEALAKIHARFFRATDRLRAYLTEEEQDHAEKKLAEKIQNGELRLQHNTAQRNTFAKCKERMRTCPKTLVHGDLFPTNVLAREGRVGFIDWADGGVLPYALDIARLTALYDVRDASPMCPFADEVCEAYYRTAYPYLQLPYEQFLTDVYMAQFIELAACYFPPIGFNQHSVHARSPFNIAVETRLLELHRLINRNPN